MYACDLRFLTLDSDNYIHRCRGSTTRVGTTWSINCGDYQTPFLAQGFSKIFAPQKSTFDNQKNQFNINFGAYLMAGQLYNATKMLNAYSIPTDGSVTDLVTGSIDPLVGLTDQEIAEGYSAAVSPSPVPLPSSAC